MTSSGILMPYSKENAKPISGNVIIPYEIPKFEGSETLEGVKSGLRDTARFLPAVGKFYTEGKEKAGIVDEEGTDVLLRGASAIYDSLPKFFGRSHADVKREEGKPLPKEVTESLRYKAGEFIGMDLPFAALDFATAGTTAVIRHGGEAILRNSLRNLALKSTYTHAAYRATANAAKNFTAAAISKGVEEAGAPEWISDLVGLTSGKYAIPKIVDKSGAYIIEKAYDYMLKKGQQTGRGTKIPSDITPNWANTSNDALTEMFLGVAQKDIATRNIMKDFVADQDKEFKNSLLNIIDLNTQMTDDAEKFLTDVLEKKSDALVQEETQIAEKLENAGQESNALNLENKAAKTKAADTQEAATQLIEDQQTIQRPNIQPQRQEIVEQSTQNLPQNQINVSDRVISNAARNIRAVAETPQDQQAARLINSIPVITEAPTTAIENIYDSISPRIGQPEAGDLYKNLRQQAYEIAVPEKRAFYKILSDAAVQSKYQIPEKQFNEFIEILNQQINTLTELPFRSNPQERALGVLNKVLSSFQSPTNMFDLGEGEMQPILDVPSIVRFWEARKSFGQSIDWNSNIPAQKILKEQYNKFNNALERQLRQAGLLKMYNEANEIYKTRFLPLEQGTNGTVKFKNPQEAGRILNLNAIEGLQNFLPLSDLNPIRRYAIEKQVGMPRTGGFNPSQQQKLLNVRRYLTPNEQAQFNTLADMELIQAQVAANQLGNIERFLESNRDKLSTEVIKNLEKVADELRANMDLPIEYVTGRAQLAELERNTTEQYEVLKGQQKQEIKGLKREVRQVRRETQEQIEKTSQRMKELNEKIKELNRSKKNVEAQKQRLQKTFLSTVLQQDTNKELLTQMSSLDGIKEMKELFGNSPTGVSIFNDLKLRKAQQIFENAASINLIAKLMKNEHSRTLLKELLPIEMYSKLENLSEFAQEMQQKLRYFVNQSNTEVQRSHVQQFKEISSAFISMFTSNPLKGVGRIVIKTALPTAAKIALAKSMTNPEALKSGYEFFKKLKEGKENKEIAKAADAWMRILFQTLISETPEKEKYKNNQKRSH